ncbi:MAG TPA: hypothetical protein VIL63_01860 [Terriglobales bacterium]
MPVTLQAVLLRLLDDWTVRPIGGVRKPLRRKVLQYCHHVEKGRSFAPCALFRFHHSTQQVTNLGTLSPVRTRLFLP